MQKASVGCDGSDFVVPDLQSCSCVCIQRDAALGSVSWEEKGKLREAAEPILGRPRSFDHISHARKHPIHRIIADRQDLKSR